MRHLAIDFLGRRYKDKPGAQEAYTHRDNDTTWEDKRADIYTV